MDQHEKDVSAFLWSGAGVEEEEEDMAEKVRGRSNAAMKPKPTAPTLAAAFAPPPALESRGKRGSQSGFILAAGRRSGMNGFVGFGSRRRLF